MEFDSSQLTNESLDLGDAQRSGDINIAGGDTISVTIGDYAHNIAIGKQITQIIQHFHTGDYVTLRDLYVPPDSVYERVRTAEFIGRHWLIARIDTFLSDPKQKCGVLVVEGEAGVGKTAVMAHLVQERNYLHLFAEQLPGDANVNRALQSLGSQIVTRYQLQEYTQHDTLPAIVGFPDFLERLLRLAASKRSKGEKIVIICDALDEAGVAANGNIFGLPAVVPDGVYILLTQRLQPVRLSFKNTNLQIIRLDPTSADNQGDVTAYLRIAARQSAIAGQLHQRGYSEEHFVKTLTERSNGIWMYLQYVIEEIGRGERDLLDLDRLPPGLAGYYAEYWSRWRDGRRGDGVEKWDILYAPLLATLAAAQAALPLERLLHWSGVTIHKYTAQRLLGEAWRAFVTQARQASPTLPPTGTVARTVPLAQVEHYSIYHASLRDFISGKVDAERLTFEARAVAAELRQRTSDAHVRIVEQLRQQCSGDWLKLIADDYARLHLTTHLQAAGEQEPAYYEELYGLVTLSNKWAQARYTKEESYAGYLVDLRRVWRQAESKAGWDVGGQIRCALIQSTIFSLAGNFYPNLLARAVETKMWSAARALAQIHQIQDEAQRAKSIMRLVSYLPSGLLGEALVMAQALSDDIWRAAALRELVPYLPEGLSWQAVREALSAVHAIADELSQAKALCELAPHLPEGLLGEALVTAQAINEFWHADALSALAPHLPEGLLGEALAMAQAIEVDVSRAKALRELASHLPEGLLGEAWAMAQAIEVDDCRIYALCGLVPYLPEWLLSEMLAEQVITDESTRVGELDGLTPHLREELLDEALSTVQEIVDERLRADALCGLASHLSEKLLGEALFTVQTIADEFSPRECAKWTDPIPARGVEGTSSSRDAVCDTGDCG